MHRPSMMFSAAHSGLLEAQEASRQVRAQEDAQPRFLWKRGFHMEGGRAGWGYYLEPVLLEAGSTDEEGAEESVGDTAVDDEQDLDAPSELYLAGESGERKRLEEWTTPGYYLESTWPRLVSHGRLVSHASQLLERFPKMAPKTHSVVSLWFALTIPVIFWDVGYCFLRPRSMVGGDLHWIWKPYALYQEVDYVYGVKALENGDGFTNAQSLLNVVENCMNIGYLYLAHVSGSPVAPLLGFASATMTLSKTVLYWLQEYYCGFCQIGHNDFQTLVLYWIIPNGLWLLVPSYIIYVLTKDITSALRVANAAGKKTKKQ